MIRIRSFSEAIKGCFVRKQNDEDDLHVFLQIIQLEIEKLLIGIPIKNNKKHLCNEWLF